MPRFRLSINQQEREFESIRQGDRLHLVSGDVAVDARLTHLGNGRYLIEYEDSDGLRRRLRVAGHRSGDQRQLWIDGRSLNASRLRQQAAAAGTGDASLASSIPAVVSQVLVQEGDQVAAGEKLVLLESMKMVIPISAPYAGRVAKLHCATGDSIPAGLVLVELEPI